MGKSDPTEWISRQLAAADEQGLRRSIRAVARSGGRFPAAGREVLNFSSNDYLNLSAELSSDGAEVAAEAVKTFGTGAASSRLMTGGFSIHRSFEEASAEFFGFEAALLFGAGYLANIGLVPALVGHGDVIFADRLVHASLIDGCALSRAELIRFTHNSIDDLEQRLNRHCAAKPSGRRLILTESVFSMDGDIAPLSQLVELAEKFEAMIVVDEAHALGVHGPGGKGLVNALGLCSKVTAVTATLSKSFASYGGLVLTKRNLCDLLINRARSQIFNTALAPVNVALAALALERIKNKPEWGSNLLAAADRAQARLSAAAGGVRSGGSGSQIIPLILGPNSRALEVSARLLAQNILVTAIRPPTVPPGTARLRISITRAHDDASIDLLTRAVTEALSAE